MFKIESLKSYSNLSKDSFLELATKIYMITDFLRKDYPAHKTWYFERHLPTIINDSANILFVRSPKDSEEIIAMACLRKNEKERKICTIYVKDEYRGHGLGTLLIESSMKWLGTTKPFITLTSYKLDMFLPIIKKYGWELTDTIKGFYKNGCEELCYNGYITTDKNSKYDLNT